MKKLKRLLAFVLSFALMLGGIEPFELKAYAATPKEYVSFVFSGGTMTTYENEGKTYVSEFTLSGADYPFAYNDWHHQDGNYVYNGNVSYCIRIANATEGSYPIPVYDSVGEAPSPSQNEFYHDEVVSSNDPSGNTSGNNTSGNDTSGNNTSGNNTGGTTTIRVFDEEAYNAAYEEWRSGLGDIYFERLEEGKFALRVKESELSNFKLSVNYHTNNLVMPICASLNVDGTVVNFSYNKPFDKLNECPVNDISLSSLRLSETNNISLNVNNSRFDVIEFNANDDNTVRWDANGHLVFNIRNEDFEFAIGLLSTDASGNVNFDESNVVNMDTTSAGFNAFYNTRCVEVPDPSGNDNSGNDNSGNDNSGNDNSGNNPKTKWVVDTDQPVGNPMLLIDPSKTYGIKYINGPEGIRPEAIYGGLGSVNLWDENAKLWEIKPSDLNESTRNENQPSYSNLYHVNFNPNFRKINGVTFKTEGGVTLYGVNINGISIGDINGTGTNFESKIVGGSRNYWDGQARKEFATFDDISYDRTSPGYLVESVTIANPDEDPKELYFEKDGCRVINGILEDASGNEYNDPNRYNSATDKVKIAVVIKDNATVTFHSKVIWAEIQSQGDLGDGERLDRTYVSTLAEAIAETESYYNKLASKDLSGNDITGNDNSGNDLSGNNFQKTLLKKLDRIDWNLRAKDVDLTKEDLDALNGMSDEIKRFICINLYNDNQNGEHGVLTVPAGETLNFPGQINGGYTLDSNDKITAGAKIVLGKGAKLNVYSVYDDSYLKLNDRNELELPRRGNVHVYEIAGDESYITIGYPEEKEDHNGASVDAVKVSGITKVTINPRSNFGSMKEDKRDSDGHTILGEDDKPIELNFEAEFNVGTIETKYIVTGKESDNQGNSWDTGHGGHFETDKNDTLSIDKVNAGRFSTFRLRGKLAKKIDSIIADTRVELEKVTGADGKAAEIGIITVSEFGDFDVNDSLLNISSLTLADNVHSNITGRENVADAIVIGSFVLGENAGVNLNGKGKVVNLTVGENAFLNIHDAFDIGQSDNDGKMAGQFVLKQRANIRAYANVNVYAEATLYGDSEIRAEGEFNFKNSVDLVSTRDGLNDVRLIKKAVSTSSFSIEGPITGDKANRDEWTGVRFALYNATDIDHVWPNEDGNVTGTLVPFTYGVAVMKVSTNNEDLFSLFTSDNGNEQNYHFADNADTSGNDEKLYDIIPDSVSFYVAEKDVSSNEFPEWGDERIVQDNQQFVDNNDILDHINEHASDYAGKKIYILVEGHFYVNGFRLPNGLDVEFVNNDPYGDNVIDVEINDGNYAAYNFSLYSVGLSFTYPDRDATYDLPDTLTLGDVTLKNGAWINACDSLKGERIVTINKVDVYGHVEEREDESRNSGIKVNDNDPRDRVVAHCDLVVTNGITVNEGSNLWINAKDLTAKNITVGENAHFNFECDKLNVESKIDLKDGSDADFWVLNTAVVNTLEVAKDARFNINASANFTAKTVQIDDEADGAHFYIEDDMTVEKLFKIGRKVRDVSVNAKKLTVKNPNQNDSEKGTFEIGEDSHSFFRLGNLDTYKLELEKDSNFNAYDYSDDVITVGVIAIGDGGLLIKDGASMDADSISVSGKTYMFGCANIRLLGHNSKNFAGGLRLSWVEDRPLRDENEDPHFQGSCLQKTEHDSNVLIDGDVEFGQLTGETVWGDIPDSENNHMNLSIEYRPVDADECSYFGAKDSVIRIRVIKGTEAPDIKKVCVNPGLDGGQTIEYVKDVSSEAFDFYELKVLGIQVRVSGKNETVEDSVLVTTPLDYNSAITYINNIGNNNQKYYVVLPGNNYRIEGAFQLPKATATSSFEIIGKCTEEDMGGWTRYETTRIEFYDDVKPNTDTTFTNVQLVSVPKVEKIPKGKTENDVRNAYTATLNTNGKNLVFDRASVNIDRQIENNDDGNWTGITTVTGNSNIIIKNGNGAGDFYVTGNMTAKTLTVSNGQVRVEGALTVSGDFKAYRDGHVVGMNGATFSGNVYMQESGLAPNNGTVTFKKNVYSTCSTIELDHEWDESIDYLLRDNMWRVVNHNLNKESLDVVDIKVTGKAYLRMTSISVNGNVSLTNLYADRDVDVIYGMDARVKNNKVVKDTFTVTKVTPVRNIMNPEWGRFDYEEEDYYWYDDSFEWAAESNWTTDLGWDPVMTHYVVGDKCDDVSGADFGSLVEVPNSGINNSNNGDGDASDNNPGNPTGNDPTGNNPGDTTGNDPSSNDTHIEYREGNLFWYDAASASTVSVRKASVEKALFAEPAKSADYANLYDGDIIGIAAAGKFAKEIAKCYLANESEAIVNTTEDSMKFILGRYYVRYAPPFALYVLKNDAKTKTLVIDRSADEKVVRLSVVPKLSDDDYTPFRIGYYKTVEEAFAKIEAIKNKSVGYNVDLCNGFESEELGKVPTYAYRVIINNVTEKEETIDGKKVTVPDVVTLKLNYPKNKYTLDLNTNVYMSDITLTADKAININLKNFALEFDNCNMKRLEFNEIKGGGVSGKSAMSFRFGEDAVAEYKASPEGYEKGGKYDITVNSVTGVGMLCLQNLAFTVKGACTIGDLDASTYCWYDDTQAANAFYDVSGNYLGDDMGCFDWDGHYCVDFGEEDNDEDDVWVDLGEDSIWGARTNSVAGYTKLFVTVDPSDTKVKKVDGVDTLVFSIKPKLNVSKDIVSDTGTKVTAVQAVTDNTGKVTPAHWNEEEVTQTFTITPCVLAGTELVSLYTYLDQQYGSTHGSELSALMSEGVPYIIGAKASASCAKYDVVTDANKCAPAATGMYIKQISGNTVYICYSTKTFAPYTVAKLVDGNEVTITDALSWAGAVKLIDKAAVKEDYVIILNHSSAAKVDVEATTEELSPITIDEAEKLTMPQAKNMKSLKIKSDTWAGNDTVPGWYFLNDKDKITLNADTTFENINFISVVFDNEAKKNVLADNTKPLTISTNYKLTIGGGVFTNGRDVILNGGTKGTLDFVESISLIGKTVDLSPSLYNIDGVSEVKMATVNLKGDAKVGTFTATNLTLDGCTVETESGKITVTNLTAKSGAVKATKGTVEITNLTVDGKNDTIITAKKVTVKGKTTVKTDTLVISGYDASDAATTVAFNGAFDVANGCTIKLDPWAYVGEGKTYASIVGTLGNSDDAVGPYYFAKAAKAPSAAVFKAASLSGSTVTPSVYDGGTNKKTFFFNKDSKGNILGYNGNSIKATVHTKALDEQKNEIDVIEGFYVTYADAVASINNKNKDFFIEVNGNTSTLEVPIELTAPAVAKALSLTVYSEDGAAVYYKKAPSFANTVTLKNIKLVPVNDKKEHVSFDIKLTAAKMLTFDNVTLYTPAENEVGPVANITASSGSIAVNGGSLAATGNISAKTLSITDTSLYGGKVTVDNLNLSGAIISYRELTVNKVLDAKNNSETGFGAKTVLNDVKVDDNDTFTLKYAGTSVEKPDVTIKGNVTGNLKLVMWVSAVESTDLAEDYALTAAEAQTIAKKAVVPKLLLTAKNLETSDFTFMLKLMIDSDHTTERIVAIPSDLTLVRNAAGAFYFVDNTTALGKNAVTLSTTEVGSPKYGYIDLTQAVKRIGDLNKTATENYVIESIGGIADTDVTGDKNDTSKLTLPADNKCISLAIKAGGELAYTGDITAIGKVDFTGSVLKPAAAAKITLRPNSKATVKVSELIINQTTPVTVTIVTGTAGLSKLTLKGTELIATSQIEKLGTISLVADGATESHIAVAKLVTIGTIESVNDTNTEANEVIVKTSANVANLSGGMVLYTPYNSTTKKNSFTLTGTANGEIKVWPSTGIDIKGTYDDTKTTIGTIDTDKANTMFDVALLVAKKANASAFEVYLMDKPTGKTPVMYKDASGQVMCGDKNSFYVEVSNEEFDTYAKTWADAVTIVDNVANKEAIYEFKLLKDGSLNADKAGKGTGTFYTPKSTSAKMITVTSDGDAKKIAFKGALNPTCSVIFDKVILEDGGSEDIFKSSIKATGAVTIGFTKAASNSKAGGLDMLTFSTITLKKGILFLGDDVNVYTNGAIDAGGIDYDGFASICPAAGAKQTYGTITSDVDKTEEPAELRLYNYFSKGTPAKSVSQLSITGKVDPDANIIVKMFEYNSNAYEPMSVEAYMEKYLLYNGTAKAPAKGTELINAPFVSMDQIGFEGEGHTIWADELMKLDGKYYFTAGMVRNVVNLDINTNKSEGDDYSELCDRHESFTSWDAAVKELDKITNADYGYQLTLLEDVGVKIGMIDYKGEGRDAKNKKVTHTDKFEGIKEVSISKLNMPKNVKDLTIVGNGNSFVFTTNSIAVNSNVTFDGVSFICLKKVTGIKEKRTNEEDGIEYTYSLTDYSAVPVSVSVSAKCNVTFNDYRGKGYIRYFNEDKDYQRVVGKSTFTAITGAATSTLTLANEGLPVIGKITGFGEATFLYGKYNITGDLNVSNVSANYGYVSAGNITVTKGKTTLETAVLRAVGAGNLKLKDVETKDQECALIAKANAKGASLLNISGTITTPDEDNYLGIGIMYSTASAENPLYVTFIEGQTVATLAKADNFKKIVLLANDGDQDDAEEGHNIGPSAEFEEAEDGKVICTRSGWYLEYAKNKTVVFRRAIAATAP